MKGMTIFDFAAFLAGGAAGLVVVGLVKKVLDAHPLK